MNVSEYLSKATNGTLTQAELEEVASALKGLEDTDYDRYDLILILGRAGAVRFESLIASFLESSDDPMLAKLALQVLCDYWGLYDKYLSFIRKFCSGVDWDVDDDVKLIALTIAGEYLSSHKDADLLKTLYEVYRSDDDVVVSHAAYSALCRSIGKEWSEIPSPKRMMEGDAIDDSIVQRILAEIGR